MHVGHGAHDVVRHHVVAVVLVHGGSVVHVAAVRQRGHLPAERVVGALHGTVVQAVIVLQINDTRISNSLTRSLFNAGSGSGSRKSSKAIDV